MKLILLYIPILCLPLSMVFSQSSKIDSLRIELDSSPPDTSQVKTILEMAGAMYSHSIDSSMQYCRRAMGLSEQINYPLGVADANRHLASAYLSKSKADSALLFINDAKEIYAELPIAKHSARLLYLEAMATQYLGDYAGSQKLYYDGLKLSKDNNWAVEEIDILNSLAIQQLGQADESGAIKVLEESLDIAERNNLITKIVRACINLSVAHDSISIRKNYLNRAISLAEPRNLKRELLYSYGSLSMIHRSLEEYPSAIKMEKKCIALAQKTGDRRAEIRTWKSLADTYNEASIPDSAAVYFRKALNEKDHTDYNTYGYLVYHGLSEVLAQMKQYPAAYDTLRKGYQLANDYYSENMKDNLAEVNAKYETEKKDAELARQEKEIAQKDNQRNILFGSFLFGLLALSSIFFWNFERQKRKKKETELALLVQQKEAEKLRELDEMKTHFFTNVSHELRTPLTLILGPLSDAIEKVKDPALKKSIHLAHSNADRLKEMINEVMDLSKLESGHIEIDSAPLSADAFIRRVTFAFESMAEMRNVQLQLDSNIDRVVISSDADKLEKILNNLLSNAIKYSPNDSIVKLQAEISNGMLNITVTDQGQGIHPNEIDKIFNRFYQSAINTAVEGGGTGVGLALSRELAELFGGTLKVTSELGKGSTFTLRIPVEILTDQVSELTDQSEAFPAIATYSPLLINGEKPHILIIEDNAEMREYLSSLLEEEYRCSFANDGYAALQKLQTGKYDIISSDIMMPQMDGLEVKKKANEIPGIKNTPFIFLTARALEEDKIAGLRLGVDDYITKPFNKYEYKARILNLLKNKIERDNWLRDSPQDLMPSGNIEEDILKNAESSILKNIADPNYKVIHLAADLNYSQRQLTRIIKKLTGLTPVNFILELRLQKAHHLLKSKAFHTVNEVRFEVGVESASYFGRKFKERFGVSPGEVC